MANKKPHWKEGGVPYSPDRKKYLSYPEYDSILVDTPEPFWKVVQIVGERRGRSSVLVWVVDIDGIEYPMFISDFVDMVMKFSPVYENPGIYDGTWEFVKKGQNYGIRMVGL